MRTKHFDQFTDGRGRVWVWIHELAGELEIPVPTIQYWQAKRCAPLGKKLKKRHRVVYVGSHPYARDYALRSEIEGAVAAIDRGQAPPPHPRKNGRITLQEAAELTGYTVEGLKTLLPKRPDLRPKAELATLSDGRLREVVTIDKRRAEQLSRERRQGRGPDPVKPGWLTARQAFDKHAIKEPTLRKAHARGRIERTQFQAPTVQSPGNELWYYKEDQVDAFAAELRSPSMLERAETFLKGLLSEGPTAYQEIRRKGLAQGISEKALRRAKNKLRVVATQPGWRQPSFWHYKGERPELPTKHHDPRSVSPTPKRKGGRPRSKETEERYKFCYEEYMARPVRKLAAIRERAKQVLALYAPKTARDVTIYAKRYAERHELPFMTRS